MIIYEEILKEFQKAEVKYVLVGGIALNLLGGLRNTLDLDMLVKMTDKNLAKIVKILKKHGYDVKQPIDPIGIVEKKTREDWINKKHMKALNFYKDDGLKEIDIIINSPISFKEARKTAVVVKISDITIPVISIDNLIKMKKNTSREVDKIDIDDLKKIKKLKKLK